MPASPGRFPFAPVLSAVLLLALLATLTRLPLKPTAWGGPRAAGFFEEGELPAAGRWSRDARLTLESLARWRSPTERLAATAEALAGYYALLAAARYAVLWLVLRRLGGSAGLATAFTLAAAVPVLALGVPRQTDADAGLLLFALLLAATSVGRLSWWLAAVGLPVLFAFWANAHASALVGLAWLGVVMVGRAVEWWRGPDADGSAVGRLVVANLLCAGAVCATPDGPRLFVDAFLVAKNPSVAGQPTWQPTDFSKPAGLPWVYFGTLGALFLVQLAAPRAYRPTALLVLLTFGFWPLVQQRGAAYWWLLVPWLLVVPTADVLDRVRAWWRRRASAGGPPGLSPPIPGWFWWGAGAAVGLIVVTSPAGLWFLTGRPRPPDRTCSADTPARAALELTADGKAEGQFAPELREVLRAYPNGRYRGGVLGGEDQGDFLAWVLDGDDTRPVMIYNRPETIQAVYWAETRKVLEGQSDWWEIAGRHQMNLIAVDPGVSGKLADRLRRDPEWAIVQDDGPGGLVVAVRREPRLPVELMGP